MHSLADRGDRSKFFFLKKHNLLRTCVSVEDVGSLLRDWAHSVLFHDCLLLRAVNRILAAAWGTSPWKQRIARDLVLTDSSVSGSDTSDIFAALRIAVSHSERENSFQRRSRVELRACEG